MTTPLSISDKDRASLDDLKNRVLKHIYTPAEVKAIKAGDLPTPGEYKEFREDLDCGIRIVFSYETQKDGFIYRHASISVWDKDRFLHTFGEPYVLAHYRESLLHLTVYSMGINPESDFAMLCWGEKGQLGTINFLQRVSDLDALRRS